LELARKMKAMDRVKEKQRADALIEVVALFAKGFESPAFLEELIE